VIVALCHLENLVFAVVVEFFVLTAQERRFVFLCFFKNKFVGRGCVWKLLAEEIEFVL
jgi:hypothetical protein